MGSSLNPKGIGGTILQQKGNYAASCNSGKLGSTTALTNGVLTAQGKNEILSRHSSANVAGGDGTYSWMKWEKLSG